MTELRLKSHLDQLMKERDLTATQLAEDASVTIRAVSGLRRNTFQLLDSRSTARICDALKVSPGELFTIERDSQ